METNEIMNNEEIMETTTEEIVRASSCRGIRIAVGVGLTALVGVAIYKYVGKPIIAKIKARKERKNVDTEIESPDESVVEGDIVEDESK